MNRFLKTVGLALLLPLIAGAAVTPSKRTVTLVHDKPATVSNTYTIRYESYDQCEKATSATIDFYAGATRIGSFAKRIEATLKLVSSGGPLGTPVSQGRVSETMRIPYSLVRKMEESGRSDFYYTRTFRYSGGATCPNLSESVRVGIKLIGPSSSGLSVNRVRIYFDTTPRADTTVERKAPLHAKVDLSYNGTGMLKGYWEVDGRMISRIYRQINGGRKITLTSPDTPPLPTFETGSHRVRFVITEPRPGIAMPEAIYFVKENPESLLAPIRLLEPKERQSVRADKMAFAWKKSPKIGVYLIEFFERNADKPLFSAQTKSDSYTVPSYVRKKIFEKGKIYRWRVVGYSDDANLIARSGEREFVLR